MIGGGITMKSARILQVGADSAKVRDAASRRTHWARSSKKLDHETEARDLSEDCWAAWARQCGCFLAGAKQLKFELRVLRRSFAPQMAVK